MAQDGGTGIYAPFARDVYSLSLGYYNNDYTPIGGSGAGAFSLSNTAPTNLDNSGNQLFNGNISNSTLSLSNLNGGLPVGYSYGYDQLNRITGMRQHTIANGASSWSNSNIINDYKEDVAYDANGNILKYLRNGTTQGGSPLGMDSLTYFYNANTNQLNTIHDSVPAGNYSVDIDNQNANNYAYDSIGNLMKDNSVGLSDVQWTVYGKIKQGNSAGITEQYSYDANNNRVIKTVQLGGITGKQYYIRDAQGNILAVYTYDGSTLKWAEQDLYGSSRVGLWSWNSTIPSKVMLPQSETDTLSDWYLLGSRDYELTNHLGNVLSVITDKKVGVSSGGSIVDYYKAEVLSQTDYYPFGMEEPGRSMSAIPYPYAFNGKRMENVELYTSNQYDYGMRYYDARVGRFYSVDPLTEKYPELSPYAFAGNTPIWATDIDGLEPEPKTVQTNAKLTEPTLTLPMISIKVVNAAVIKESIVQNIYDAINKNIPSKNEMHDIYNNRRYEGEENIIKGIISDNLYIDPNNLSEAVLFGPNTHKPSLLLKITKGTVKYLSGEANPFVVKAMGELTSSLGIKIGTQAEMARFLNKYNLRADKLWRNPETIEQAETVARISKYLGTALKIGGAVIDRISTAALIYEGIDVSPKEVNEEDIINATKKSLTDYIKNLNKEEK